MKKINYKTSDNININGILNKNQDVKNDTCVIMCHGIRADKDEHGNFIKLEELLTQNNIDSFRFDFRGHGENDSSFNIVTISGEIIDLEATIDYIDSLGYKNIFLLGASFGAGIISLIDFKKYNNIKGLVLWYPSIIYSETDIFCEENLEKAIKEGFLETKSIKTGKTFRFTKELMLETTQYDPYKALLNSNLKKIFISGDKDEIINYISVEKCAKESTNSKFIKIQNGTHGFFDNKGHFELVLKETLDYIVKSEKSI